jgi:branched-subunit amino acid transport protein
MKDPLHQVDGATDYVGAPTSLADAQEMPEWVSLLTKALFFVPATVVAALSVPIVIIGAALMLCAACALLEAFF